MSVAEQPDSLVLEILRGIRADIAGVKAELNSVREDMATKADLNSLRSDVASELLRMNDQIAALRKETREQIVGVRRALTEYHSAGVGHGMLISDLEERVRRIEQRLDLPAPGAH